ncbi:hypothetical protein SKAU_G00365160 [Synaphobranchus kaupii]|uniref:Uncharacterized protein n=1 Tax=Synaphobranchus kaupii TaxID=118154 RepID=A0A9Q1EEX8_SYNKA|nr:hypothetical protein SKAU_G00365160 [Synaphobranchus kaupii]
MGRIVSVQEPGRSQRDCGTPGPECWKLGGTCRITQSSRVQGHVGLPGGSSEGQSECSARPGRGAVCLRDDVSGDGRVKANSLKCKGEEELMQLAPLDAAEPIQFTG